MVVRWNFYDPILDESFEFPLNPNDGGLPSFEKNIQGEMTTATDGRKILFEGTSKASEISFSGSLLEKSDFDWFISWYNKKYQVLLTDDLDNETWVYLVSFIPKRKRSFQHDWAISYEARVSIVDWP